MMFAPGVEGWQLTSDWPWIPDMGARLTLSIDGLSAPMLVMTVLLMPLTLLGTWNNVKTKTPVYGALVLGAYEWIGWHLHCNGLVVVLRGVGIDAGSDVFHCWNLGRC